MIFYLFFINALLLLGHLPGQETISGPAFEINDEKTEFHDLKTHASVYSDTSGALAFDIIQQKEFLTLEEFKTDIDVNVYWIRLSIKSNLNHTTSWRLSLFEGWCEEVLVYTRNKSENEWFLQRSGFQCPVNLLDKNPAVPSNITKTPDAISIVLEPGIEKEIFIRYQRTMRYYLFISPKLESMARAANKLVEYNGSAFSTIFIMAIFLILSLYHLVVFIMLKDIAYLYYSLYSFCVIFAATIMDQYFILNYELFYSSFPYLHAWVFNWIGNLTIIFYILFTRAYLHTRSRFPILDKVLVALLGYGILMTVIININYMITGRQYVPGMPFEAQVILLAIVFGILLILIWRKKQLMDKFYLLGVGVALLILIPGYLEILFKHNSPAPYQAHILSVSAMQISLIAELIIFSVGLGYRTRLIMIDKQRVEELQLLKSKFFANISHEFRTPLTLIMGPLESIKSKLTDAKDINLVKLAQQNAKGLLHLINQILDLSKLESKNIKLQAGLVDIVPFLKGIFYSFESLSNQKNISLAFDNSDEKIEIYLDQKKFESIFSNLLSNSIKFSNNGDKIHLELIKQKKNLTILLSDSGIGISSEDLPNIFNRFYQGKTESSFNDQGSGIGLALVKELIVLHHGTISADSKVGQGTVFKMTFPLGNNHLQDHEITISSEKEINEARVMRELMSSGLSLSEENSELLNDSEIVLIIEDNMDVRAFIRSQLSDLFRIEEAEDGNQGIEKAVQLCPDLIICDVMMPEKDGYEVCGILKKDIRTSHIPIIMLTAKAASEEKIEGLQSGADDYLIKPFDSEELRVRVRNLIDLRKSLRQRFSTAIQILPSEVSANSADQEFLTRATLLIEHHMEDESFNIDVMTRELGISATQLNRKLRSLIDQSTNQFIKSIRLQRAADLLQKNVGTVSEIAFMTGFSSTTYFATVFKNHFMVTPGEYREANQNPPNSKK